MKKDIHPSYREVVFLDMSTGKKFLCRSAVNTTETTDYEGKSYPCYKVSISSDSHPFYTGDQAFVDTEGRVDKFKKRYAAKPVASVKKVEEKEEESKEEKEEKKEKRAKTPSKKAAVKGSSEKAPKTAKIDSEKSALKAKKK